MGENFDKTDEQIEAEVRGILSFHKGEKNPISRWELVERVFGREAAANRSNNNAFDRKIRDVIAKYREIDLIVSTSGSSGYWLATDMNDIEKVAQELEKRSKDMLSQASKLRKRGIEKFGPQIAMPFGKPN
jgi:hypothetical protein